MLYYLATALAWGNVWPSLCNAHNGMDHIKLYEVLMTVEKALHFWMEHMNRERGHVKATCYGKRL
jgi:hypothetical protein